MSIFSRFLKWWNSKTYDKPTTEMTTQELKDEYKKLYDEYVLTSEITIGKRMRMDVIEDRLKGKGVYINSSGVNVYFLEK